MKCNISQIWHVGWSPILVDSLINHLPHTTLLSTSACFESLKAANEHEVSPQNSWCPKNSKNSRLKVSLFPKTHIFSTWCKNTTSFYGCCHPRWDLSEDGPGTWLFSICVSPEIQVVLKCNQISFWMVVSNIVFFPSLFGVLIFSQGMLGFYGLFPNLPRPESIGPI